jgi:serine phosphatase RsbU (regulator of sigma subunit)
MRLLHGNTGTAEALVDRVLQDVMSFQQGTARDDIALLALRVPENH